jgi:6-phosphofructokinase 1
MKIRRIGILTSGGDTPGMNACIRAVVRSSTFYGLEIWGIFRGFAGLIEGEMKPFHARSVSNIINRGGTILKTDRSEKFKTLAGQREAIKQIASHAIDALIVIGGNGTGRGAYALSKRWRMPLVLVPSTIDNDLNGTEITIGADTAVDTALEAIDRIRDTATSMERIFLVEVMGRKSGYIAIEAGLAGGAENIVIPEIKYSLNKICGGIKAGIEKGKLSWIIVVAEGAAKATDLAKKISQKTGCETRVTVLGHIQRGGSPSSDDRILATKFGIKAVEALRKGKFHKMVAMVNNRITLRSLDLVLQKKKQQVKELYRLAQILAV